MSCPRSWEDQDCTDRNVRYNNDRDREMYRSIGLGGIRDGEACSSVYTSIGSFLSTARHPHLLRVLHADGIE